MDDLILEERDLGDGTTLSVYRMLFNVRLCHGLTGSLFIDRSWCYDVRNKDACLRDAREWDAESEHPPGPWMKCVHTGEFRPEMQQAVA